MIAKKIKRSISTRVAMVQTQYQTQDLQHRRWWDQPWDLQCSNTGTRTNIHAHTNNRTYTRRRRWDQDPGFAISLTQGHAQHTSTVQTTYLPWTISPMICHFISSMVRNITKNITRWAPGNTIARNRGAQYEDDMRPKNNMLTTQDAKWRHIMTDSWNPLVE